MFRTQANPMDDVVVKATDENLTSENWALILDACDRVSASPSGPSQAVSSLIKRLAHRNANVQLYTLELANALSQNCGPTIHRELASKAFTDALLRLAGDRNTHAQVKQKVLERMEGWTEEFGQNPDLGIMEQAYQKLRLQQPGLMPPSKPGKREISGEDRRKEDSELQMALALSVQDKGLAQVNGVGDGGQTERDDGESLPTSQAGPGAAQQGTTAATVSRVRALYDFTPSEPGELRFQKNDIIAVLESVYKDWWKGSLRGETGIFPLNYVEKLQDPTREEIERDAQMEAEVFGQIKNVEKLLALLSVGEGAGGRRGEREEEEIAELYQRTLSIRPKLIELIGKYSQKKDDFTQLNEKFIKARRDYEYMLESSMSIPQYGQPQQQQYPVRARQPAHPLQQQQHQPPYGGPSQGYPPQGPPTAQGYGPPPQQAYAPNQSQQHLPPHQPDQQQRYYSPAPSEPSGPGPQQQPAPGYAPPYQPQHNVAPPSVQQPANGGVAPFHFIPGGLQGPPPNQPQQGPPQQQSLPPQQDHQQHIRRKPSPGQIPISAVNSPPSDPYVAMGAPPSALPALGQGGFRGQIRPNSIHTLNSGNPQELGTGGYESPIDNRHSYAGPGLDYGYTSQSQVAPQQQSQGVGQRSDRDALPSRQRTQSFESPTSLYSQQTSAEVPYPAAPMSGGGAPPMPVGAPPGVPGSPGVMPSQYQAYQAYQPAVPVEQQRLPSGGSVGGGDPGDFYR